MPKGLQHRCPIPACEAGLRRLGQVLDGPDHCPALKELDLRGDAGLSLRSLAALVQAL